MRTEVAWQEADLQAWVNASRLNLVGRLADHPDQDAVRALQGRFLAALFPALDNLEQLAGAASEPDARTG